MITFYLMNIKGYKVLEAVTNRYNRDIIDQIIVERDPNIQYDYYNEILRLCKKNQLKFFNRNEYINVESKFLFAVGWRWIINNLNGQLIIFHDSILPKYRGFAPLVSCLINEEKKIGVTSIIADGEYDHGDIIGQKVIDIQYPIKIKDAIEKIIPLYQELVLEACEVIINNREFIRIKQDHKKASYSLWRDEDDYKIDWSKDANYIKRFIDTVGFPYKGALTTIDGKNVRILNAELVPDVLIENRCAGKIIFMENDYPIVVCGEGLLKLTEVIDENTKNNILPLKKFRLRFGI